MTCEEAQMVSPLVIPLGSSARFAVSLFLTRLSVPDDESDSSGARAMSRALANTRCRVRAEPSPSAIGSDREVPLDVVLAVPFKCWSLLVAGTG